MPVKAHSFSDGGLVAQDLCCCFLGILLCCVLLVFFLQNLSFGTFERALICVHVCQKRFIPPDVSHLWVYYPQFWFRISEHVFSHSVSDELLDDWTKRTKWVNMPRFAWKQQLEIPLLTKIRKYPCSTTPQQQQEEIPLLNRKSIPASNWEKVKSRKFEQLCEKISAKREQKRAQTRK